MKNILIIEDDINLIELYQTKFALEGYEVITASDGQEGLEGAKVKRPDIILLDILMPNINGFEVLKQLKEFEGTKNIPVIVYTNLGTTDADAKRELAYSLGAADYLVKALHEPDAIVLRVKELLTPNSQDTRHKPDAARPNQKD